MRYEVIEGYDASDLSTKINAKLTEGWKLYGNVVPVLLGQGNMNQAIFTFFQAMVKEEREEIEANANELRERFRELTQGLT